MTPTAASDTITANGCTARLEANILELRNSSAVFRWRIDRHGLVGIEYAATGLLEAPSAPPADTPSPARLRADDQPPPPVQAASLRAILELGDSPRRYRLEMFADVPAVRLQAADPQQRTASASSTVLSDGVEPAIPAASDDDNAAATIHQFQLRPPHCRLLQVVLRSQTDHFYELVQVRRWEHLRSVHGFSIRGNLFCIEDILGSGGLMLMRHGMLPHACPPPRAGRADLALNGGQVTWLDHAGPLFEDGYGDWHAILAYDGGTASRCAVIQAYEQCLRRPETAPPVMVSNTWGDRARDAHLNEAFMLAEVDAAKELGVDIVQIDDGWQSGRSANSMEGGGKWSGFWEDDHFWEPHAGRFPNGLSPITGHLGADQRLGLWYAPDSCDDFSNWRKDADRLLTLHRRHGVCHFKLDAMTVTSRTGEANVHRLLDALQRESDGRIVIDLDTTASTRLDYLARPDVGPIFVENRYTDWGNYYPHLALRSLWQLAHWIDPARLRMEWLNPDRNPDRYPADPLAPAGYSADYLFATTLPAAPLAWMELQHLSPKRAAGVKPIIRLWRTYRRELHECVIVPIGDAPTGAGWTGFAFIDRAGGQRLAHLLLFREPLAGEASVSLDLPAEGGRLDILHGHSATCDLSGIRLHAALPTPGSVLWARNAP